jgi:hypothetical protein
MKAAQSATKSKPKASKGTEAERWELPPAWRELRSIFKPEVRRKVARAFRRGVSNEDLLALELAVIASLAEDPKANARYLSAHLRHAKELASSVRWKRDHEKRGML